MGEGVVGGEIGRTNIWVPFKQLICFLFFFKWIG